MADNQNKTQSPSFSLAVPEGDDRRRLICDTCGHIQYVNPKIVVGSVVRWDDRVLLCRRAISPRKGFWTLPAGYLEEHETTEAGAKREAREEACAEIAIDALLAVYNITHLSQVQLIYRARLVTPEIAPGPESTDVGLFGQEAIPWEELAFPSVVWALTHERTAAAVQTFAPFSNPEGATGLSFPERPET